MTALSGVAQRPLPKRIIANASRMQEESLSVYQASFPRKEQISQDPKDTGLRPRLCSPALPRLLTPPPHPVPCPSPAARPPGPPPPPYRAAHTTREHLTRICRARVLATRTRAHAHGHGLRRAEGCLRPWYTLRNTRAPAELTSNSPAILFSPSPRNRTFRHRVYYVTRATGSGINRDA
jgi:hypothetical protein